MAKKVKKTAAEKQAAKQTRRQYEQMMALNACNRVMLESSIRWCNNILVEVTSASAGTHDKVAKHLQHAIRNLAAADSELRFPGRKLNNDDGQ